jgi:Zn-dependent protease with chaperone function
MKREKFEAISAGAEHLYQRHPKLYKSILGAMAILGYAYILIILLVLLSLFILLLISVFSGVVNGGTIKLLIILGIFSWLILRGLWIKFTPPFGLRITSKEAPRLVAMVEDVCRRLGAPRVSEIVLDGTFNAGILQLPRLGIFGWYRNYLTVGLPLLDALSPEQFKAVVAHEFGHLSGSHGKFGIWIYRVHQTWQQVIQNFSEHRSVAVYLFLPFYKWFVPRFSAFAYVQNRLHEFEADRLSATIAGSENTVNALVRIHFYGEMLDERFWPEIYKLADTEAAIPAPYGEIGPFVKSFNDYIAADFAVRRSFQQKHEGADSHPVLAERIAAVEGMAPGISRERVEQFVRMCLVHEPSAAEICLDGQREHLITQIDSIWQKMLESDWAQRHAYMKQQREELVRLETMASSQLLDTQQSLHYARLTEAIHGPQKALTLYQQLTVSDPGNMEARFAVGKILLEQKDASGLCLIEQVMEKIPASRLAGCELLAKYYYDIGELEKAKTWRFKIDDEYQTAQAVENERASLTNADKFIPHGLDDTVLGRIRECLATISIPMRVCLAQKVVRLSPETPCYVLVAYRVGSWWRWSESRKARKKNQELLEQLAEKIRMPFCIYIHVESSPLIYKKVNKIAGAQVFISAE